MHASQWVKRRGYRMRLELPSLVAYRDEPLTGQAHVESVSTSEITVKNLRVWAWVVTGDGSSRASAKATVVQSDRLPPLEQRSYPVELKFAPKAAIGNGTVMLTAGLAIFPGAAIPVMVAPERRLATLVELIAEITHHEIDGWHATGGSDGAFAQLRPREEVEDRFHGIGVELYPSGSGVYGTINVVPRDQGLLGVVQAAVLADSRSRRFRFRTCDAEEARRDFEPFLLPYVNDLRTLPIPARRVECVESLPLPGSAETGE